MARDVRGPVIVWLVVSILVVAMWAILGRAVPMPASPLAPGEKLPCVSYAPFRKGQSPLDRTTQISPSQIDEDLAQLSKITACVRTYSVELGLDQVTPIAHKYGLKVYQGIWLGSDPIRNRKEIKAGIALAQRYPDTIAAMVVGNEVMLRGELSAADLSSILKQVKAGVGTIPVTYADVWEFWERAKALAADVDFITVHILPYWEDMPVSAEEAGAHVDKIRQHVADQFPGKDILIGETGWPSAGRMREGALPSPSNQARVLHDVVRLAKDKAYRVNVIEAYDQPWKRRNEGTVGGHWGLIEAGSRQLKFHWGMPVSDHPLWMLQAFAGVALAAGAIGMARLGAQRAGRRPGFGEWIAVAAIAFAGGGTMGGALAALPLESLGWVGWTRNGAVVALSLVTALLTPALLTGGVALTSLAVALDGALRRTASRGAVAASALLALTVLALGTSALELIFDPRYKDFGYFALSAPVVAMLVLSLVRRPDRTGIGMAETASFWLLLVGGLYVPLNETLKNWQAVWFGLLCLALAFTLWRVRAGRGRE